MKLFNNIIIYPKELYTLFGYDDFINQFKIRKQINNIYKVTVYSTIMFCILTIGLILIMWLSYRIEEINVKLTIILITTFLIFGEFIHSYIRNRYIFQDNDQLSSRYLNLLRNDFKNYLNDNENNNMNILYSNIGGIGFKLNMLIEAFLQIVIVFSTLMFVPVSVHFKIFVILLGISFFIILMIIGNLFNKARLNLLDYDINNIDYSKKDLYIRSITPSFVNVFSMAFWPIFIALVAVSKNHYVVAQLAILSSVIYFSWNLVEMAQSFMIAKKSLVVINNTLHKLTTRNIVNNAGYKILVGNTYTSDQIINLSKKNNSLIIKDFIPKCLTNTRKTSRKYSFEFTPGIYQLNGVNGVGKTVLLESITLTNEELVEMISGQGAFNGKPLYIPKSDLYKHRQRFMYIGRYSPEYKLNKKSVESFKSNPHIRNFLNNLVNDKKIKYSEGEKAIIAICYHLSKIKESSFIVIDELISRVYEDDKNPIRTEIIKIIENFANSNGHIVIVVDHVIRISGAKQLKLTKNNLEFI